MHSIPVLALAPLALAGCFLWRSPEPPPAPLVEEELAEEDPQEPAVPAPAAPPVEKVEPVAIPIQLTLRASDLLNPDDRGAPLPTMVVIYQLKSAARLASADAEDLYRQPKQVLGEDLLQADELQLAPGQIQTRTIERDKAARTLAVVALVRRPAGAAWRSIVGLPAFDQPADLTFVLDGYRVDRK